ncbi:MULTISPECIES: YgaP family membrane protein [Chloroflexus]|uniref:Inner membrane protein YgaP-like transmembrane domain-containing protein n=1 Tax=Chloroflexus aggregans (strain MD-66 / DSM 9485) TaxID=326427 RepID=B8G695_CHLAD|nr:MULTISPECIES: DUF2892 domain-containing protein [Chloroflexus]ACL23832.1 conserved hypothetical protein [Chloroflexus aggregans DSM 9485]GIV90100.1 MAG: hypothetical protein KatS3mg055_2618 [Chloroflexus sp.]
MFTRNVGTLDRDIRLVLTMTFGLISLFGQLFWLQIITGFLALIMFATAAFAVCPLYWPFGINTYTREQERKQAHKHSR